MTRNLGPTPTGPHTTSLLVSLAVVTFVAGVAVGAVQFAFINVWTTGYYIVGAAIVGAAIALLVMAAVAESDEVARQEAALQAAAVTGRKWRKRRVNPSDVDTLRRLLADAERRAETAPSAVSKRGTGK